MPDTVRIYNGVFLSLRGSQHYFCIIGTCSTKLREQEQEREHILYLNTLFLVIEDVCNKEEVFSLNNRVWHLHINKEWQENDEGGRF